MIVKSHSVSSWNARIFTNILKFIFIYIMWGFITFKNVSALGENCQCNYYYFIVDKKMLFLRYSHILIYHIYISVYLGGQLWNSCIRKQRLELHSTTSTCHTRQTPMQLQFRPARSHHLYIALLWSHTDENKVQQFVDPACRHTKSVAEWELRELSW